MQSENSTSATGATAPSGRGRAGDLRTRFLSALVLGPLVLLAVYFGGWIFQLLMLSFALLAAAEWVRLVEPERTLSIASLAITAVGAVLVADFVAGVEISLALAAVLTVARMSRGPSSLDRVVAADVLIAVVIAALALEAILNDHSTTLPVMLVLSLLGFAGSVSIARFVADRDKAIRWDVETQRRPASRVSRRPDRQEGP